jgi:hypothetical protein
LLRCIVDINRHADFHMFVIVSLGCLPAISAEAGI